MKWVSMAEQLNTSLRSPCKMPSVGWSGIKLSAIGLWSSVNAFSGVMNPASASGRPTDIYGFGGCQQSCHIARSIQRSIQKWFVEIGVEELDWTAQSPDLNPIKHLLDELDRRLPARPKRPTFVPGQTNALVAVWKQVPAAMFQHLVESLPRRVEAIIAAKSGTTTY
jgi:hypothetical protein